MAFKNGEKDAFEREVNTFLKVLGDVDAILAGRPEFSLKKWIKDALCWVKQKKKSAV